jgi:hypothetical protein
VDLRDTVWQLKQKLNQEVADDGCDIEIGDAQMKHDLQEEVLKKEAELEVKGKEIDALMEQVESKGKEVEAMTALFKKQKGCHCTLVYLLMFVVGFFVALMLCKNHVVRCL